MRGTALLVLAVALLALSGCGSAPKAPAGLTGVTTDKGIELKASMATSTFAPGAVPLVDVEVRNTGTESVPYVRFNGCDPGFAVRIQPGTGYFAPQGAPRACTEAIEFGTLAPGGTIKARFEYRANAGTKPLDGGKHTISVRFNRGGAPDALLPVVVPLDVTVISN